MNEDDILTGIPAIIEAARAKTETTVIDVSPEEELSVPMVAVPKAGGGVELRSVKAEVDAWREEYRTNPKRRRGTAVLEELASFIAHAVRFKDANSAVFVNGGASTPKFTAVLDYHERVNATGPKGEAEVQASALPRFGEHRGTYTPQFSAEWQAWKAVNGKALSQADFAKLITDNARDIYDVDAHDPARLAELPAWFAGKYGRGRAAADFFASSQRLLDLSEGLTVTVQDRVGDVARRDSGETKITFESERATDIEIPIAFVIELPVFLGGDLWQIPVRLRFTLRTEGDTKRAQWTISMFGTERTVLAVMADMRTTVGTATGLPVFAGAPE